MPDTAQPLYALIGPTASGKSALGVSLVEALRASGQPAAIVNMDSMQIYRELPIITAQPTIEERGDVDHHLYGVVPGAERATVARWIELARAKMDELRQQGIMPVLVGGTGLYLKVLLEGIADIPPIPPEVQQQAQAQAEELGIAALHAMVREVDPIIADRLKENDTQRVLRAWEVFLATGTPLSTWQAQGKNGALQNVDLRALVLLPPREKLYDKINLRFTNMVGQGVVEEVAAFLDQKLDPMMPAMKAHGVPEIARYLAGDWSLDDAIARAQQITRNYAKRQFTWFTHQLIEPYEGVGAVKAFGAEEAAIEAARALVK